MLGRGEGTRCNVSRQAVCPSAAAGRSPRPSHDCCRGRGRALPSVLALPTDRCSGRGLAEGIDRVRLHGRVVNVQVREYADRSTGEMKKAIRLNVLDEDDTADGEPQSIAVPEHHVKLVQSLTFGQDVELRLRFIKGSMFDGRKTDARMGLIDVRKAGSKAGTGAGAAANAA